LINIQILSKSYFLNCFNLIKNETGDLELFKNIGWSYSQFEKQFLLDCNLAIGLFENKNLVSFIVGNLITIENITEYEILIIYVNKQKRRLGYASQLLENMEIILKLRQLKKIYLEVAANNKIAMSLYEDKGYLKTGIRKKYYKIKDKKIDAFLFEKNINDKI